MLVLAQMEVRIPHDADPVPVAKLRAGILSGLPLRSSWTSR